MVMRKMVMHKDESRGGAQGGAADADGGGEGVGKKEERRGKNG